ncbi:hypothetical protein DM01DRAFT_342788 [Hesseltinella vesiculosa]|uniref:Uncharacterized protein n=1 Tax=Hesseltinella vesiculosa TaxID=101127 RepID=A0A1X2GW40_9FUNG|nr:hypothetical protein DM01DRAFT_342788 [Hesseltinella vesiculosa]
MLKQLSKNLRVNAQILNHAPGTIHEIMTMDFVGTSGYLYSLKKKPTWNTLSLVPWPVSCCQKMHLLKPTIAALFHFKEFLIDSAAKIQENALETLINDALPSLNLPTTFDHKRNRPSVS